MVPKQLSPSKARKQSCGQFCRKYLPAPCGSCTGKPCAAPASVDSTGLPVCEDGVWLAQLCVNKPPDHGQVLFAAVLQVQAIVKVKLGLVQIRRSGQRSESHLPVGDGRISVTTIGASCARTICQVCKRGGFHPSNTTRAFAVVCTGERVQRRQEVYCMRLSCGHQLESRTPSAIVCQALNLGRSVRESSRSTGTSSLIEAPSSGASLALRLSSDCSMQSHHVQRITAALRIPAGALYTRCPEDCASADALEP